MFIRNIFLIVFVFATMLSCFNPNLGKSLEKADSLEVSLKQIEEQYSKIDHQKIYAIYDTIKLKTDTLKRILYDFPKNKEWREKLSVFEDVAKQTKHFVKNKYRYEIEFSNNQILKLRTDISNNAIDADSVLIYLQQEKDAIDELKNKVDMQYNDYKIILEKYYKSIPYVDLIIDSLLQNNKTDSISKK